MEFIDRVSSDDLSEKKVLEEEQSKGLTIAVTNLAQDLSGSNLGSSFVSCSSGCLRTTWLYVRVAMYGNCAAIWPCRWFAQSLRRFAFAFPEFSF